ncbi:hypothetical protein WJX82_002210 [Trebouxia sp. C0006]
MSSEEAKITAALTAYVRNALLCKTLGQDATTYRELVKHVSQVRGIVCGQHSQQAAAEKHQLALLLQACTRHVSYIRSDHHGMLVAELLAISLWICGEEVLKGTLDFVVKLLVANGSMVSFCLRRLVFCLIPPNPLLEAPIPGETWQPPAQQAAVQDHIIKALADILLLVPTAPKTMLSELSQRMPFKIVNRAAPCMYFRAVYQLSQMPAGDCLRDGLQAAMVDCLLNIDVEIKWQDIADQQADHVADEHDSEDEQDVFALEGRTGQDLQEQTIQTLDEAAADPSISRGGWEGAAATQDVVPVASTSDRSPIDETADTLDSLMELTFDHLLWRCNDAAQLQRTWAVMLAAFDRTLLHTYRSKFTQFLVYYMCQQSLLGCASAFVSFLLKRIHDPNRPAITRTACAAYLASFLARAKFLPKPLLIQSLLSMAQWCADYCKTQDQRQLATSFPATSTFELGIQHQVFYAMCQGLLYAFCYHLDSLLSTDADDMDAVDPSQLHISDAAPPTSKPEDKACMQPADIRHTLSDLLPRILHHRLSPLTVCAPSVAHQFLQQAQRLSLLDCTSLQTTVASAHMQVRPLEMFFPFDPYLLRRSARFLKLPSSYNTWGGGHQHDTDASHLSSDDELEVPEGAESQTDSSSEEEDAEFEPQSLQGQSMGISFQSKPLGITRQCRDRMTSLQQESKGLYKDSSLGSSPKLMGSFEPIPMSC